MKPNLTTIENCEHKFADRAQTARFAQPKINCNYTAATFAGFRGRNAILASELHSFRKMSDNYFTQEAPRSFVEEAAVFGVICVTAALPIFSGVNALAHFFGVINGF